MDAVLKKLRHLGQTPVLAMNVPDELAALPRELGVAGARVDSEPGGAYPWAIVFVKSLAETAEVARMADGLIEGDGILWVAYPKQTSKKYRVDVNRDKAWALFESTPTRLVAQTAIDDDWSALRVRRTEFSKK